MLFAVVTAPRPWGADYLPGLLAQLRQQGATPLIYCDDERRGQAHAYRTALRLALDVALPREPITILEDDIEICRGAVEYITRFPLQLFTHVAFVSWFDAHQAPPGAPPGITYATTGTFYNLQAVTWHHAIAAAAVASPAWDRWPRRHEGDVLIREVLSGKRYAVHTPNLVQHVGDASICNPGLLVRGNRISQNWRGPDFDVRSIGGAVVNRALTRWRRKLRRQRTG
jgi:hypothetical protein